MERCQSWMIGTWFRGVLRRAMAASKPKLSDDAACMNVRFSSRTKYLLKPPKFCLRTLSVLNDGGILGPNRRCERPLRTSGMNRYSHNPQDVADIAMIVGRSLLCFSAGAALFGVSGIAVLVAGPSLRNHGLKNNTVPLSRTTKRNSGVFSRKNGMVQRQIITKIHNLESHGAVSDLLRKAGSVKTQPVLL